MWFDGIRQPNTLYIANTSRGKDSTAMLRAIELMGWPLDMICAVDIWATQDIPAELPPMVAFKDDYDRKVFDWFGVPVTRLCATKRERERESCTRVSYSDMFYSELGRGKFTGSIKGFPLVRGSWCKHLKTSKVDLRGYILSQSVSQERERERETEDAETRASTASRRSRGIGATQTSREHLWLPSQSYRQLVYRTQAAPIKGFPWRKGAWCQDRLKGNSLDRVF